jgi:GntR family transcriptional regulator
LESIETMAQRSSLSVDFGALHVEHRLPTAEEYSALGIPPDEQVLHISRVILAEGRPAAYLVDALPLDVLDSNALGEDFNGSLLDLLVQRDGPAPLGSRTEISAAPASPQVARALGIQRGDVLLCFIANLYNPAGRVIDHSYSYFVPGYFRFHVVRKLTQEYVIK